MRRLSTTTTQLKSSTLKNPIMASSRKETNAELDMTERNEETFLLSPAGVMDIDQKERIVKVDERVVDSTSLPTMMGDHQPGAPPPMNSPNFQTTGPKFLADAFLEDNICSSGMNSFASRMSVSSKFSLPTDPSNSSLLSINDDEKAGIPMAYNGLGEERIRALSKEKMCASGMNSLASMSVSSSSDQSSYRQTTRANKHKGLLSNAAAGPSTLSLALQNLHMENHAISLGDEHFWDPSNHSALTSGGRKSQPDESWSSSLNSFASAAYMPSSVKQGVLATDISTLSLTAGSSRNGLSGEEVQASSTTTPVLGAGRILSLMQSDTCSSGPNSTMESTLSIDTNTNSSFRTFESIQHSRSNNNSGLSFMSVTSLRNEEDLHPEDPNTMHHSFGSELSWLPESKDTETAFDPNGSNITEGGHSHPEPHDVRWHPPAAEVDGRTTEVPALLSPVPPAANSEHNLVPVATSHMAHSAWNPQLSPVKESLGGSGRDSQSDGNDAKLPARGFDITVAHGSEAESDDEVRPTDADLICGRGGGSKDPTSDVLFAMISTV